MNNVSLMGRLTADPTLRYTNSAEPVAVVRFNIAVDRVKKGEADFISCIGFQKTAEVIANHFKKGNKIVLAGHIQSGSYDKEGRKIYTTDVVVDRFYFCDPKPQDGAQTPKAQTPGDVDGFMQLDQDDSDLPF